MMHSFLKEHWALTAACAIWFGATVTAIASAEPLNALPCAMTLILLASLLRHAWRSHLANWAVPATNQGSVTLTAQQLLEVLDFVAPDRATDPQQLETEVSIQYGEGHSGRGHYCWLADYPEEGSLPLFDAPQQPAGGA